MRDRTADLRPLARRIGVGIGGRWLLAMDPTGEAVARQERLVLPQAVSEIRDKVQVLFYQLGCTVSLLIDRWHERTSSC